MIIESYERRATGHVARHVLGRSDDIFFRIWIGSRGVSRVDFAFTFAAAAYTISCDWNRVFS
jgi:hypothetical protein